MNGVIFLDLKKAFDTVEHDILLSKLAFYELQSQTVDWFKSYLSNRQQLCYVNGVPSDKNAFSCGVPQVALWVRVGLSNSPPDFSDLVPVDPLPGVCLHRTNRRHYFIHQENAPISDCSCLLPELTTDMSQQYT